MRDAKERILIVDDAPMNREMLAQILREDYEIIEATNGREALEVIAREKEALAVILLDLMMPELDGFGVMEELQKMELMDKIPVLVISGETAVESEKRCLDYGVADFIGKPYSAVIAKKRVENVIAQYAYRNRLEEKVAEQTVVLRKAYQTLKSQAEKLGRINEQIIDMMATIVEYRNLESGEHIQRVKGYTKILAEECAKRYPEYGLDEAQIARIVSAAALHDIGKIAIPDKILLKPGRLTKEEFDVMKSHTLHGCELLDAVKVEWEEKDRQVSYEIIRHHHEKYDGKGYPDGLVGDDIPISAQLVSVADCYDALVNERCYKDAFSPEEAYHMILHGECGVFSPKMMEVFRASREAFESFFVASAND